MIRFSGIPFDKDTFKYRMETGGHQRRLVPLLLERTGFDVLTALEFARSYDIEGAMTIRPLFPKYDAHVLAMYRRLCDRRVR